MGPKKKGGKKGKKGKKGEKEPEVLPEFKEMSGEALVSTIATMKDNLLEAKIKRNMLQMEKDMIHDFYHNTR